MEEPVASEQEALILELARLIPASLYVEAYSDDQPQRPVPLYMSPQTEALTGYADHEWAEDPQLWMKVIHPEDQQRVVTSTWRTTLEGEPYDLEYRMVRRDGKILSVREVAATRRDYEGRRDLWFGVMIFGDVASDNESSIPRQ